MSTDVFDKYVLTDVDAPLDEVVVSPPTLSEDVKNYRRLSDRLTERGDAAQLALYEVEDSLKRAENSKFIWDTLHLLAIISSAINLLKLFIESKNQLEAFSRRIEKDHFSSSFDFGTLNRVNNSYNFASFPDESIRKLEQDYKRVEQNISPLVLFAWKNMFRLIHPSRK